MRAALAGVLVAAGACGAPARAEEPGRVVGAPFAYEVARGDSLTSVGARFGVETAALARANGLEPAAWLKPGQTLAVDNRHVVPEQLADGILINLPQRMLFFFRDGALAGHYPVGLGRPSWPTPAGAFIVRTLEQEKVWYVPPSIQEEMRRCGEPVRTIVPPGPDNPLGTHWIGLSLPGYGIHGTIAPASVYHFQSHGCIRMHPDDVAALVARVRLGEQGQIVYVPVLLGADAQGRVFLEVHRDVYRRAGDPTAAARGLLERDGLADRVDWGRITEVVRLREGLARDVSR